MEWIKASERLPEKDLNYAIKIDGIIGVAYFNANGRFMVGDGQAEYYEKAYYARIFWLDESTPQPVKEFTYKDLNKAFWAGFYEHESKGELAGTTNSDFEYWLSEYKAKQESK